MNKNVLVIAVSIAMATVGLAQAAPPTPVSPNHHQGYAPLSGAQRGELVAKIVRTWGPYVQKVHGTSAGAWAKRMQLTFNAATDANLQRAVGMKTFQGAVDALTGMQLSDARVMDSLATQAQVLGSNPGTALLGSTSADLVYTPLAPCRIADTRNVGGPISGGFSRDFRGYTATNFAAQGGIATSNCGIPANPSALMINVAAPNSAAGGYLTVWPYGTTKPFASNLDYKAGDLANNEMAAKMTIGSATAEFSVYANGTTNVVVDVVGYFMAPQATGLNTITVSADGPVAAGTDGYVYYPACPTTYVQTGGYCGGPYNVAGGYLLETGPYACTYRNLSAASIFIVATTQCARIPGR